VKEAKTFRRPDYVYPGYSYAPWAELAKLLVSIAPSGLTKAFRATGGSEAVDLAQAAMIHTSRRGFISLEESYHGNSLGGLSVGDSQNRERVRNLLPHCSKIKPPLNEQALDKVERRLKGRNVAAFIIEPIGINLGVLIPEQRFMQGLQRLCRKYGTLLIADEVATGFGRTGKLFASEHFDLRLDIMCVAKAITGGLGGMGAALMTAPGREVDGRTRQLLLNLRLASAQRRCVDRRAALHHQARETPAPRRSQAKRLHCRATLADSIQGTRQHPCQRIGLRNRARGRTLRLATAGEVPPPRPPLLTRKRLHPAPLACAQP
jgi:4-aminobutyrate aminotransferase-like enzyme